MRILVAPDKFKGTLSAAAAAQAICDALVQADDRIDARAVPMADGGDGTLAVAREQGYLERAAPAVDGRGRKVQAPYAVRGRQAFIELAAVCGLASVLDLPLRPWEASTLGLGLVARHAVEAGAREVTIGLGGSASVDGGLGFAVGLGCRVSDRLGLPVPPGLLGVRRAVRVSTRGFTEAVRRARWRFLVDVSNPLLGPTGAAAVFGPQKGLLEEEIAVADASIAAWVDLLDPKGGRRQAAEPGMGAAGGVALAGTLLLDAQVLPGAEWVAEQARLSEQIAEADIVITGEGRFDDQSLMGKAPGLVIDLARQQGKPVYVIAGSSQVSQQDAIAAGVTGQVSLAQLAGDPDAAMAAPLPWLSTAATVLLAQMPDRGSSG